MIKHTILIALTVVSFSVESQVVSAATDMANSAAPVSAVTAPLAREAKAAGQKLAYHVSNPAHAIASGKASLNTLTSTLNSFGLPTAGQHKPLFLE